MPTAPLRPQVTAIQPTQAVRVDIPGSVEHRTQPPSPYAPYRRAIPTDRLRELSRLRPRRVLRDTLACWLCILVGWALAARGFADGGWPLVWMLTLALPLIGSRYYALFILGHDGMHRRIFNSGPASELFTDLFHIGCIGMVCRVNARNHLLHHAHLADDADPDLHKHACFNKATRAEYLLFLTGLSSLFTVLANLFNRSRRAPAARQPSSLDEHLPVARGRYTARDAAIILAWQLALLVGLTALIGAARGGLSVLDIAALGWFAYPLLWALPVYLFAYLPNLLRSFAEHSHPESDDLADSHRLITYRSSTIERFFLAPMNMNFHIAHHLWPSIPYYNLPIADAEVRASDHTSGLTWRGSYLAYLWRFWVALPLAACIADRRRPAHAQSSPEQVA